MSYATFLRQRRRNDVINRTPKTEDLGYYPYIAGAALNPALKVKDVPGVNRKTNTQRLQEEGYIAGTSATGAVNVPVTPETVTPEPVTPEEVAPELTDAEQLAAWGATRGYTPTTVTAPKYEAAITPEMSYAEYLKRTGMQGVSQRQYDATVRTTEADYAKGKATYGQKAETLGQRGLTGSGYGDYLTGASFAAMQNAKVAAADTKALTEAEIARGYGDYITGVQQANAQAAAQAANANEEARVAAENANAQAAAEAEAYNKQQFETERTDVKNMIADGVANRLTDEEIMSRIQTKYGNAFDGSVSAWINKSRTALQSDIEAANTTEANKVYAENIGTLGNANTRQQMLDAGYTEEQIDAAMAKYSSDLLASTLEGLNYNTTVDANGNAVEWSSDLVPTNAMIDDMVNAGRLTEADAATLKAAAVDKRNKLLSEEFENDVNTAEEEAAFFEKIDKLRESGDISTKAYKGLYKQRLEANLETLLDSNEEPLVALASLNQFISSIADNVSGGLAAYLRGELADEFDVKLRTAGLQTEKGDNGELVLMPVMDITIGGKTERIDFLWNVLPLGPEERSALGEGKKNELKSYGENLYFHNGSSWKKVVLPSNWAYGNTNIGGKDNAKALYNLLVDKYR